MQKIVEIFTDFCDAISGNYESKNDHYNMVIEYYYPEDGIIKDLEMSHDIKNMAGDFSVSIKDARVAAKKKIDILEAQL